MDRRLFVTGLVGVAGAAALAAVVSPHAEALAGVLPDGPPPGARVLPNLDDLKADPDEVETAAPDEGVQLASHRYRHYRRYRRWRWHRYCRRYWHHGYWRRRCYRRRSRVWIWI